MVAHLGLRGGRWLTGGHLAHWWVRGGSLGGSANSLREGLLIHWGTYSGSLLVRGGFLWRRCHPGEDVMTHGWYQMAQWGTW